MRTTARSRWRFSRRRSRCLRASSRRKEARTVLLAPYYRSFELPWEGDREPRELFGKLLRAGIIVLLLSTAIFYFVPPPKRTHMEESVPPRLARVMIEQQQKPPPPPPPVVEQPKPKPPEPD